MSAATIEKEAIGEQAAPEEIVAWMLDRFEDRKLVLTTSFGMEGCALIDMVARRERRVRVIYLDTMFLFPETYRLRDTLIARYPQLRFENWGTPLTSEEQEAKYGPELWRRNPDACCRLRKVEPMRRALHDMDVWVTGLMRSQSPTRASIKVVEWDWTFQLLRVNPLAGWDRVKVWDYIQRRHVPYNELHERGYPTIGCTHCTVAVPGAGPDTYSREGRWAGREKTECGLHLESRVAGRGSQLEQTRVASPE